MSPSKDHKKKHHSSRHDDDSSRSHRKHKHKHEKSHKKEEDSRSSSSPDARELKLMLRLTEQREKEIRDRKRQKEIMKATETPEEKRIRRLMKKEAKEKRRKELMGWDNDYLHYTNSDNPFGDSNLLSTFVWNKKLAKEGVVDVTHEDIEARNRQKMEENKRELEKVKKRRLERELERQERDEELSRLQRGKEAAQFQEWERAEDQFHLEQARLRSHIRIQDGRAKPIDLLAKYISSEEEVDAVEMHEPYTYLNGLSLKDLEDLLEDIKVYIELEKGKNLDYWNDITIIVRDELQKIRKLENSAEYDSMVNRRDGIHESVTQDVAQVFRGKTVTQLAQLQNQIENKISGSKEGIDVGYWESLLSQLKAHMARARLRDRHQENLKKKLELLKAEQGVESKVDIQVEDEPEKEVEIAKEEESDVKGDNDEYEEAVNTLLGDCFAEYDNGNYSPRYLSNDELPPGTITISELDDEKRLDFTRLRVQDSEAPIETILSMQEKLLQQAARKGMTAEETEFSVESAIEHQIYLWSDKYRPRKPRYFNRVHTGFEWNKYNQTHYDMDNPPPKIVQGYKFNIFYPDLIDKSITPEYFLTLCPENNDFAILRFKSGPPYEDIAFKIVHREWEYSYKRGFRCQFHNNIFQLWFHFKRYRYRR